MASTERPDTRAELAALLSSRRAQARLVGTGSRQQRLPDAGEAMRIDLSAFTTIARLDAEDLTCSVGAGLKRDEFDAILRDRGVCLPCFGGGSLGGLFASDPFGPMTIGGPSPRSLLLGLEGVLADGTEFRSGARVVKSVAGFDLHKLFVGSRGQLFATVELHLRLQPLPRASVWCERAALDGEAAIAAYLRLRNEATPPTLVLLRREAGGFVVRARIDGRPTLIRRLLRTHELTEGPPSNELHLPTPPAGEVLTGNITPSTIAPLLERAPAEAPFVAFAGGRFELALPSPQATDDLMASMPELGLHACIATGAADRRGRGTRIDPGQQRLTAALRSTLDPHGILV